jgi:hypothetical protein
MGSFHCLFPTMHAQLAKNAFGMSFDRVDRNIQFAADLLIHQAIVYQRKDFRFSLGERKTLPLVGKRF